MLFRQFRYCRALGRGFGVRSQNALGFADLLQRRYGIAVRMLGLDGHAVAQVELPEGAVIADPSLGVTVPFDLRRAERQLGEVRAAYTGSEDTAVWRSYDPAGNVLAERLGSASYARPAWKLDLIDRLESAADWAAVALPALAALFFAWRLWSAERRG